MLAVFMTVRACPVLMSATRDLAHLWPSHHHVLLSLTTAVWGILCFLIGGGKLEVLRQRKKRSGHPTGGEDNTDDSNSDDGNILKKLQPHPGDKCCREKGTTGREILADNHESMNGGAGVFLDDERRQ